MYCIWWINVSWYSIIIRNLNNLTKLYNFFSPPNVVPNRSQIVGKAKIHWNTLQGLRKIWCTNILLLTCPYHQNFYFLISSYISCNELRQKKFSIWIKSDLLWMFKNLKILFSCGRPVPLNTTSTCSELRNMWRQACLILLVLPLWCEWWTKMAANMNVFKTLKKDCILSKWNFSFACIGWL